MSETLLAVAWKETEDEREGNDGQREKIIEGLPTKVVFSMCVSNESGVFEGWDRIMVHDLRTTCSSPDFSTGGCLTPDLHKDAIGAEASKASKNACIFERKLCDLVTIN